MAFAGFGLWSWPQSWPQVGPDVNKLYRTVAEESLI